MVWEHVDLNELTNDIKGLPACSSSEKKVDAVVQVVDLLVDWTCSFLFTFFCCSAIFLLTMSVKLVLEFGLYAGVELYVGVELEFGFGVTLRLLL
jgi:hypothetical protein